MTDAPLPGGDATPLNPRARARQALTVLVHETGSGTICLSGLTLADVRIDLETLVAEAIVRAEDDAVRDYETQLTLARQQVEKLQQDNDKWRSLLKTTGGAIPLDLPSILHRAESAEAQVTDTTELLVLAHNRMNELRAEVTALHQERDELLRTVTSVATMLGWGNVPPRETLERSISALKARGDAAEQPLAAMKAKP